MRRCDRQLGSGSATTEVLLLVALLCALGLAAFWFCFGEMKLVAEPLRIVTGACTIFLLPGLIWGELLRLRGRSPLETIALAFVVTIALELCLLPVVLLLGTHIQTWTALLLGLTAAGVATLGYQVVAGRRLEFIGGLLTLPGRSVWERGVHLACALVPVALSAAAYHWSEAIEDIGGEKYLHLMFVRYYAELPLVLDNLGIEQGCPPPNLINLWEFLLAGWASCIRTDPLPLFCHARMVIPLLGLAGMYLLVRMVFIAQRRCAAIFAGVLVLCLGQLVLNTGCTSWITAADPTRGVFAFFGTAHHSDAAGDILLALTTGMCLLTLRQPRPVHLILLAALLAADFLWHVREFFQTALYLGALGVVALLVPTLRRPVVFRRWLLTMSVLVAVAFGAAATSMALTPRAWHAYDELAIKKTVLRFAVDGSQIIRVRNPFNFPWNFTRTPGQDAAAHLPTLADVDQQSRSRWNFDRWWVLALASTVVLAWLGGTRDRQLAAYHFVLWQLALCWNASMLLIQALTYSEFFFGAPRQLYLFSYLVIAAAALLGGSLVYRCVAKGIGAMGTPSPVKGAVRVVVASLLIAVAGYALANVAAPDGREQRRLATVLGWTSVVLLLPLFARRAPWLQPANALPLGLAVTLVLVTLLALSAKTLAASARRLSAHACPEISWFDDANPLRYSKELIQWARSLPRQQRFAANPTTFALLPVYAPHYLCVHPRCLFRDIPEQQRTMLGQHPFYAPPAANVPSKVRAVDHGRAVQWLRERSADYVIIDRHDYQAGVQAYFISHPELYEVAFANPAKSEIVFHLRYALPR
jgi:hypothetical protein